MSVMGRPADTVSAEAPAQPRAHPCLDQRPSVSTQARFIGSVISNSCPSFSTQRNPAATTCTCSLLRVGASLIPEQLLGMASHECGQRLRGPLQPISHTWLQCSPHACGCSWSLSPESNARRPAAQDALAEQCAARLCVGREYDPAKTPCDQAAMARSKHAGWAAWAQVGVKRSLHWQCAPDWPKDCGALTAL